VIPSTVCKQNKGLASLQERDAIVDEMFLVMERLWGKNYFAWMMMGKDME
jgi:hypothetical protein